MSHPRPRPARRYGARPDRAHCADGGGRKSQSVITGQLQLDEPADAMGPDRSAQPQGHRPEPLPVGHPLYRHRRVYLSPHASVIFEEGYLALQDAFLDNCARYPKQAPLRGWTPSAATVPDFWRAS
ncbi:hypothetical protein [Pseudomonas sp.]|uniref:hypothetical protein n=1 Tax=Pseudomonas sp. TaxID=306 RepID=UPI00257A71B2|nr:hypothetical protein [Pseudomonas sp.]